MTLHATDPFNVVMTCFSMVVGKVSAGVEATFVPPPPLVALPWVRHKGGEEPK